MSSRRFRSASNRLSLVSLVCLLALRLSHLLLGSPLQITSNCEGEKRSNTARKPRQRRSRRRACQRSRMPCLSRWQKGGEFSACEYACSSTYDVLAHCMCENVFRVHVRACCEPSWCVCVRNSWSQSSPMLLRSVSACMPSAAVKMIEGACILPSNCRGVLTKQCSS